jgi:Peptidase family M1 domain
VRKRLAVAGVVAGSILTASAAPAQTPFVCTASEVVPAPPAELARYTLSVRIAKGLREARGSLVVRFAPEQATDRLVFRLWANQAFLAIRGSRLTITDLRLDGRATVPRLPNPTTLVVRKQIAAGQEVVTSMPWRLRLPDDPRARLYGNGKGARLATFFPLLAWEPGSGWQLDPPSAIGWETWTSPSANFDVTVRAPPGLDVLATGERSTRGRWRASRVRDFALAIGCFDIVTGVGDAGGPVRVEVAVERPGRTLARRLLRAGRAALREHARRYGRYPWPTLTLVGMDMDRYSFEYPALVFVSTDEKPSETAAHEIAHQWFYSLAGNNQARDPWLDEALATWAGARFTRTLAKVTAQTIPEPVRNQLGQPMRFWDQFDVRLFVDGVYVQGVQALASLGPPDAVDCALRRYAAGWSYRTARPEDLLRALESEFEGARRKLEGYGARF